jgi:putative transposase
MRPRCLQRRPRRTTPRLPGRGADQRHRNPTSGDHSGQADPERAWLAEVASVALIQACQDARRAHRNRVDSLTGKRKGCRVGRPRFRTKHGRQSIRLTRNGFALRGTRLYLAKVGLVRVRWSRELPSVPSSITVIRAPDGRYYASFVVERDPTPLPPVPRTAGIDLGLISFAAIAASDGTIETIANPRHLRAAERRLAIAPSGSSAARRRSRRTGRSRACGLRSPTVGCATSAPTIITSSPCG